MKRKRWSWQIAILEGVERSVSSRPFSPFPSQDDRCILLLRMKTCGIARSFTIYGIGDRRLFLWSQVQNVESRGIDAGADYLNEIRQLSMFGWENLRAI